MADNEFSVESPENYEQKSICCLVLDLSWSMHGKPIEELNHGLQEFHADIASNSTTANRLEVALVTFADKPTVVQKPALVANFSIPKFVAGGTTAMVDGVREAITLVDNRKKWYKSTGQPHQRPWIILITDGSPNSNQDYVALASEIEKSTKEKSFVFLPIGVEGADMKVLTKIAGYFQDDNKGWVQMPPMKLSGLKFHDFFKWVSASMDLYAASKEGDKLNFPNPTWMDGFKV